MSESLFEQYKAALRRGHMAALAGELDDALAAYDTAARLVPERALPLASRGTVLHRLDRWPEAAEAFDRALQLAPDDEAALRARATARADRGLRSGAAADFERLAFVLDVAGRAAPAAEAARRAADMEPSATRDGLAERLEAAAAQLADLHPPATRERREPAAEATEAVAAEPPREDPWSAALDASRLAGASQGAEDGAEPGTGTAQSTAYDAIDALRAGIGDAGADPDADGTQADATSSDTIDGPGVDGESIEGERVEGQSVAAESADGAGPEATNGAWPGIDLPSPPPDPIEGTPPDPETLLTEAALVLEAGEVDAARDLMLTAARVHREAGRIDAALEICLNLLSIAPGDPRVHLAIANLQLDRGWMGVATEKLDLLVRLTSLTGDTQAEADVHGLASERLRDEPAPSAAGR